MRFVISYIDIFKENDKVDRDLLLSTINDINNEIFYNALRIEEKNDYINFINKDSEIEWQIIDESFHTHTDDEIKIFTKTRICLELYHIYSHNRWINNILLYEVVKRMDLKALSYWDNVYYKPKPPSKNFIQHVARFDYGIEISKNNKWMDLFNEKEEKSKSYNRALENAKKDLDKELFDILIDKKIEKRIKNLNELL